MQKHVQYKAFSETYTDIQQQERKQIINLIFPQNLSMSQQELQKLDQKLRQNFNPSEHRENLVNYAFKNHHPGPAQIYRAFLNEKYPQISQPKISMYYQNDLFPDLKTIGQYRNDPGQYPKRHVSPLQESAFVQLDELFSGFGYIPNLERFLVFFPRFLQKIRVAQKQLFEHGKIDQQTTYFFGLCAAAQIGCPYMINRMAIKYLSKGGKIQWIVKKKYSQKIASILPLNRKLARCVWEITPEDIEQIIEGGFWNINQLALIIQILSFVHLQCVITLGLGLVPEQKNTLVSTEKIQNELKVYRQSKLQASLNSKKQPLKEVITTLKIIIEEMKNSVQVVQPKVNPKKSFRKQRKSSVEEEQNFIVEPYMKDIGTELTQQNLVAKVLDEMSSFLPKYNAIQKRRDNKHSNQLTCVDFNFQFRAFPRLQSLGFVAQSTKKILGMLKESEQMGYQNFGSEMIGSTKQFRKAQRYYGQNLCGFSHPEYDYKRFVILDQKKMNNILPVPLKFYIRLLMLSPLHMRRQVLDQICHQSGEVQLFDLGHTAILIAAAKFKLSLTLTTYYFDY